MVEVFKTDVRDPAHALLVQDYLHNLFPHYESNFDLDDCDRILRIKSSVGISVSLVIQLLHNKGVEAKVLPEVTDFADLLQ